MPTCEAVDERRQRVLTLTMWRRFAFVAPLVALLVAVQAGLPGSGIGALLDLARQVWPLIPGHAIVDRVVAAIATLTGLVDGAAIVGLSALVAITLALSVHAAFPVRRSRVWRDHPLTFGLVVFLDWIPAAAILAIVLFPLIAAFVGVFLGATGASTLLLLLLGLALFFLVVGLSAHAAQADKDQTTKRSDVLAGIATMAFLFPAIALTVIAILVDDTVRNLVVGAALAFLVFRPLVGYGSGRWERWDRVERAALRAGTRRPRRRSRAFEAAALVAIGIVLALGLIGLAIELPSVGSVSVMWLAFVVLIGYAVVASTTDATVVEG